MAFYRGGTATGAATMGLQGERELRKLLKELGPRIERKVTRGAMKKAAKPIVAAARANAKRLGHREYGALLKVYSAKKARQTGRRRRPLTFRQEAKQFRKATKTGQLAASIGIRQKTYTAQGVVFTAIGPKWPQGAHGHLIEYGHKPSGWYARQSGARYVPAYPFMRPAYESSKHAALQLAIQEHRARIEREAQKAGYHARAGRIGATWKWIKAMGR